MAGARPVEVDGPGATHLAGVAVGHDAGVEGDEVTGLDPPVAGRSGAAPRRR